MLSRQETGKEWDCPPSQKYKSCQWYLSVHSISNWITPVKYNISRLREVLSLFIEGVALFLLTPLRVDSLASSLQRSAVWVPDCWLSLSLASTLSSWGTLTSISLSLLLYPLELVSKASCLSVSALLSFLLVTVTQTEEFLHTADTVIVVKAPFIYTCVGRWYTVIGTLLRVLYVRSLVLSVREQRIKLISNIDTLEIHIKNYIVQCGWCSCMWYTLLHLQEAHFW